MLLATKEKKWILVVDDDSDIRDSIKEVVGLNFGRDVAVVEAKDGMDATTKINYQKFDCIITDLSMPRKEGEPFINSVRHNNLNELTPIIIVSGNPDIDKVAQQFEFVESIAKPYKLDDITSALRVHLKVGDNKNRISANVLNTLIDGLDGFIKQMMDEGIGQSGALTVKRKGEGVGESLVSTIQIQMGKVKNTFSIMVEEEDLKKLKERCEMDQDIEKIMESMSYVILKHVMMKTGLINKEKFGANSIHHEREILTDKRGLVIKLGNEDFKVNIFATTQ